MCSWVYYLNKYEYLLKQVWIHVWSCVTPPNPLLQFLLRKIQGIMSVCPPLLYTHSISLHTCIHRYIIKSFKNKSQYISHKYIATFFNIIKYLVIEELGLLIGILRFPELRGSVTGWKCVRMGQKNRKCTRSGSPISLCLFYKTEPWNILFNERTLSFKENGNY